MKVAPSILASDFSVLRNEILEITEKGADYIHLDIMDGHFVPNITFGPGVVAAIRPYTTVPFDCHLMIENPDLFIPEFVKAGADLITVHEEACLDLNKTLNLIKSFNIKAGVVIKPETPVKNIKHVLSICDIVLVMSVDPGFGGQPFIESSTDKIKSLRTLREVHNDHYLIEVDGGVNAETAKKCKESGADIVVAGSYIFKSQDRQKAIDSLR